MCEPPLPMGFSRKEYWNGLMGTFLTQGWNPLLLSPVLAGGFLQLALPAKSFVVVVVQLSSRVQLFVTPWTAACQASLSFTISQRLIKLISIKSVLPFIHLIFCHPLSSCLQCFPASGPSQISWLFTSGGQSIGVSASSSVLPMNIQDWFPLGFTALISLQSKGISRVFSNTIVQKHQFFCIQTSLWSNSHIHT